MQMGLIGLGWMGANMREGLRTGHDVVGFDSARSASDLQPRPEFVDRHGFGGPVGAGNSVKTMHTSGQLDSPTMKAVSALRQQFGGHQVSTKEVVQS
jgi:6-phosphogluconate dehydrogenase (decarboxylating)